MNERGSVAVLGGGIGGLASAYFLTKHGYRPVVFEGSPGLGGLGGALDHQGVQLDRFYHVLLETDSELLALIDEVGASDRLEWRPTGMGFYLDGRVYGLNTPLDLLRFAALPVSDRLRLAWGALRATQLQRDPMRLDAVEAREWLERLFGMRVTQRLWAPLLRAKFGDAADSIPAYWLWSLLSREKNGGPEVKGYLRGGYQRLADELCRAIRRHGGQVRLGFPIERLERHGERWTIANHDECADFDAVVSTLPLAVLRRVATGRLAEELPLPELRYQGVVNALIVARRRLQPFYWTVVVEPRFGFQGVVETTHVIPPEWLGGRHLIYLMNYCDAASPLYQQSDAAVQEQALRGLHLLYPELERDQIEAIHVSRAPHVEPVWSLGYTRKRPPARLAPGLYLCTTAQAYPRVTSWNTSVALAREAVEALMAAPPMPRRIRRPREERAAALPRRRPPQLAAEPRPRRPHASGGPAFCRTGRMTDGH